MSLRKRSYEEEDDRDIYGGKVWSCSQRRALKAVLLHGKSIFITGAGGVGKSECIRHIVKEMRDRGLKVGVTAHTGVAAVTIQGQTLFSFMYFTKEKLSKTKEEIAKEVLENSFKCKALASYRALIIDEISMVDPKVFEIMDHVLKLTRRDYRPFGGLQLVLTGDFCQLEPVDGDYCFKSEVWKELELTNVYLKKMMRQKYKLKNNAMV